MWIYENQEFNPNFQDIKKYEGFVYFIENTITGKKYLGKKSFKSHRTLPGASRKKTLESDWRKYYGSSEDVKDDVKQFGKDNFKRIILKLCKYKKQMSFWETKYQWDNNVLEGDGWYNTNISGTFFKAELYIYNYKDNINDAT